MSTWQDLLHELDEWKRRGRTATFWWRDDDAITATPALDRLLALRRHHDVPVGLAVIPARADTTLPDRLAAEPDVVILQHGWAHANYAPVGMPKAEFGPDRSVPFMLGELARGRLIIGRLFGPKAIEVLVPPHNRIAPDLAAALPQAGYSGLSTYGPRKRPIAGLALINTHVDIMNWTTRSFAGEQICLTLMLNHLQARRRGDVDAAEPTGLLSHHLAHDEVAWRFLDALLAALRAHAAVRFVGAAEAFGSA
ncbi:MAG TPA: polysaccharide deacetylase family protein [Alphaproteobacteria bacterium]